jgi:hypothetical protein
MVWLDADVEMNAQPPAATGSRRRCTLRRSRDRPSCQIALRRGADPTLRDVQHQSAAIEWTGHARGPRSLARAVSILMGKRGAPSELHAVTRRDPLTRHIPFWSAPQAT